MLVLSRRIDEEVWIGDGSDRIIVRVIGLRGDRVRLGFTAPENVVIDRSEVAEAKERGKR